ncbi:hypothetical protein WICMUC_002321 [Wickerhamomyces mucosus]|uniref:Uncharacterized protein n=1 Tax=Wickerhamomyces mucosus TaxID=1378264 RepID=A0A9P8TEV7_9ASCO|nr:hypothetical protein WICMUC_002321 [Wickerhamomyces mucosus]
MVNYSKGISSEATRRPISCRENVDVNTKEAKRNKLAILLRELNRNIQTQNSSNKARNSVSAPVTAELPDGGNK